MHLLVIPERHVETFREIGEFRPHEAKRMLEFVAETRARGGLEDYRVVVNVGPSAPGRQCSTCTGTSSAGGCEGCPHEPDRRAEGGLEEAMLARDDARATRCG